jgi:hypothetical protein
MGSGTAACGGAGRRSSPVTLELELPASDFDGTKMKTKIGTLGTYLDTWRGGRSGGEGDRGGGAPAGGGAPVSGCDGAAQARRRWGGGAGRGEARARVS